MPSIYLDHAATTPLDPRVLKAMSPFWNEQFGNPSSLHHYGQQAPAVLEGARQQVAGVLGCKPAEISFTGGGSESDNLALRGAALAQRKAHGKKHLITSPIEHHAVGHTMTSLRDDFGYDLTVLPVDSRGWVDPDDVRRAIRRDTALISVMYANNEIGTMEPLAEIGRVAREHGVPLHTDAVQAAGQLPLKVDELTALCRFMSSAVEADDLLLPDYRGGVELGNEGEALDTGGGIDYQRHILPYGKTLIWHLYISFSVDY